MTMARQVALDTNVLVALIDDHDKWHEEARSLHGALEAEQIELIYFDCVLNETVSVLARRAHEQKRVEEFVPMLDGLVCLIPADMVTWVSNESQRLYESVVELVRDSQGALNFNDALIALFCREIGVSTIVTFDRDFDLAPWLQRLDRPGFAGR